MANDGADTKPKRKRRTKAEIEADKAAKLVNKSKPMIAEEAKPPIVHGPEVIVEFEDGVSGAKGKKSTKKE